jgi:hypothetical protein
MLELILALALFVVYLGLRERLVSPLMYAWVDIFVLLLLVYRQVRYDETVSFYLIFLLSVGTVLRALRRDTPTAVP